jgi:hypothetical protein
MKTIILICLIFTVGFMIYSVIAIILGNLIRLLCEINRMLFILHIKVFDPSFFKSLEDEADSSEKENVERNVDR